MGGVGLQHLGRITRALQLLLGVLAGTLLLLIPAVQRDVAGLFERLPDYLDGLLARVVPFLNRLGIPVPGSLQEGLEAFRSGELALTLEEARGVLNRAHPYNWTSRYMPPQPAP